MECIKTPVRVNVHYEWNGDSIALWDRVGGGPFAIVPEQEDQQDIANEIEAALNAHDALVEACEFWLGAVQNSLGLRLALTELPEGAGPILVDMLQDALALVRGEADDA